MILFNKEFTHHSIILTFVVSNGCKLFQLHVNNAFLNGFLEETVYITQPPGVELNDKFFVLKRNKAICELKQAPC